MLPIMEEEIEPNPPSRRIPFTNMVLGDTPRTLISTASPPLLITETPGSRASASAAIGIGKFPDLLFRNHILNISVCDLGVDSLRLSAGHGGDDHLLALDGGYH